MKRTITLKESELKRMISESVKRVLMENRIRKSIRGGYLKENADITAKLDAMYKRGDYSKLYADPRLCREDVYYTGSVPLYGEDDEEFVPEDASYIIEDYLQSHDLDDIQLMGGDWYSGGQTGEPAAGTIVHFLLGKTPEEIEEQLGYWAETDQL